MAVRNDLTVSINHKLKEAGKRVITGADIRGRLLRGIARPD